MAHERPAIEDRIYLVLSTGETTRVVDLADGQSLTLGRDSDCDVVVDDKRVSRHHARLTRTGDSIVVEDLKSANGTKVNRTILFGEKKTFGAGDVVWVASAEILVASSPRLLGARAAQPARSLGGQEPASQDLVVADPCMVHTLSVARRVALAPATVLILGETGVGKEVVAEYVHAASPRAKAPFVRLNCASLPEGLLESELFGHERGAFTGADRRKIGYFEAAQGGTLLLDEIGEISPSTQVKFLRVLESRRMARLGSTAEVELDVRVICATHRDLVADVAEGRFRQDLYYRLSALTIQVPPLRERPLEVALLTRLFADRMASGMGLPPPLVEAETEAILARYAWPGNVRELRNAIEHAVVMASGTAIRPEHLPELVLRGRAASTPAATVLKDRLDEIERNAIEAALAMHGGNQTRAAEQLGVARRTLVYKITKYGLRR
jgi:DNA-binding NtrC family response regulator